MEKLYIKKGNRYEPIGYSSSPELFEGIWLVTCSQGSKSMSNLVTRISDLPQPVDIQKIVSYLIYEEKLTKFIYEFFKEGNNNGKGICGDMDDARLYNISSSDFALKILKFLFQESEKLKK